MREYFNEDCMQGMKLDHTEQKPCATCKYHDWEWDEHIGFRNICKGIGKCPYNVEETVTSEPTGTRQCEKCKWHFTDGNESYCQRDYHDLPCIYEEYKGDTK